VTIEVVLIVVAKGRMPLSSARAPRKSGRAIEPLVLDVAETP
jgi:hypothetical protein